MFVEATGKKLVEGGGGRGLFASNPFLIRVTEPYFLKQLHFTFPQELLFQKILFI